MQYLCGFLGLPFFIDHEERKVICADTLKSKLVDLLLFGRNTWKDFCGKLEIGMVWNIH